MRWILLDRIVECDPGKSVRAVRTFPADTPFFSYHFPDYPIIPGVLQVEMMAHAGSRCISLTTPDQLAILGSIKSARFYKPIGPDEECDIRVTVSSIRSSHAVATGEIYVNGERRSTAEIMFAMIPRSKVDTTHFKRTLDPLKADGSASYESNPLG